MLLALCSLRVDRLLLKFNNLPLLRNTITTTPIRSNMFNIGKRIKNEPYYKKLDKVDPKFELIYMTPFEYLTAFSKHGPTFNLLFVSSIIGWKLLNGMHVIDPGTELEIGGMMSDGTDLIGLSIGFYVMNIGLLLAVRQCPLRVYKSGKQYCAIFEGHLPFRPTQYSFKQGEVSKVDSILPWHMCIYKMKDKTMVVLQHHFRKPIDFNDMIKK